MFWIKYGTQSDIRFTMVKRGVVDLAASADWTPAAADSAISKDGGNLADTTNTVAYLGGSPTRSGVVCKLTVSATEAQAAELTIQIVDAATKAVEDQVLVVYTYGNASAKFAGDWSDLVRLGLTALPNAAAEATGGLFTRGTGAGQINQEDNGFISVNLKAILRTTLTETAGLIAAGFKKFFNVATPTGTVNSLPDAVPDASGGLPVTGTRLTAIPTLPAALVGGRMDSSVGAVQAGAITNAAFAAGAIDSAAIATDAIGSAELATSAITEIQSGLSTLDAAAIRTAVGLATANMDTQLATLATAAALAAAKTVIDTISAKTTNLPSDPADASDVAGAFSTVNSTLGTLATAANLALAKADTAAIKLKTDNLPSSPAAVSDIPTASTIAAAVQTSAGITPLPANVKKVNDVTIDGTGVEGDEWAP